jgi:hypothetical protein
VVLGLDADPARPPSWRIWLPRVTSKSAVLKSPSVGVPWKYWGVIGWPGSRTQYESSTPLS